MTKVGLDEMRPLPTPTRADLHFDPGWIWGGFEYAHVQPGNGTLAITVVVVRNASALTLMIRGLKDSIRTPGPKVHHAEVRNVFVSWLATKSLSRADRQRIQAIPRLLADLNGE